jgi:hypothetical protein
MSRSQIRLMATQIETARVRRTLRDKLLLWRRAFETKIFDERRQAVGRGPTVEVSREAALAIWVTDGQHEFEAAGKITALRRREPSQIFPSPRLGKRPRRPDLDTLRKG